MRLRARVLWFLLMPAILVSLAHARVVRVEVTSRADIQEGKPFGSAGAYKKIVGRVYFAVDPANLHNQQIVDLDLRRNTRAQRSFHRRRRFQMACLPEK